MPKKQQPRRPRKGAKPKRREDVTVGRPADGRLVPIPVNGAMQIHRFTRTTSPVAIAKVAADGGSMQNMSIAIVPGLAEFSGLFDRYRIDRYDICYSFQPGVVAVQFPTLHIAYDLDGGAAPATLLALQEYGSYQRVEFDATHRSTSFANRKPGVIVDPAGVSRLATSPWLDLAVTGTSHHGFATWLEDYNTTVASGTLEVFFKVHMSFRGVR